MPAQKKSAKPATKAVLSEITLFTSAGPQNFKTLSDVSFDEGVVSFLLTKDIGGKQVPVTVRLVGGPVLVAQAEIAVGNEAK